MTFIHGKGSAYSLDDNDLSIYGTQIKFSRKADKHDVTTHGRNSHVYFSGLKDGTASIEGIYDNTAVTGPAVTLKALIGGPNVELVYMPEGDAVGKPVATVMVLVETYDETAPVADMVKFSCELQFSGDVADTVGA